MDLDVSTSGTAPAVTRAGGHTSRKGAKGRRFKRRRYFVSPTVQVRMTAELILLWLVGAALAAVNLYVLHALAELYQTDALRIGPAHWEENLMVWAYGVVSVVIAAIIFLLACVFYTHRIAGPQRKLELHLAAIADGDLRHRVSLRKTDHLRDLARAINIVARKHGQSLSKVRSSTERVRDAAERNDASGVLEHCTEIERAIEQYKLSGDENH